MHAEKNDAARGGSIRTSSFSDRHASPVATWKMNATPDRNQATMSTAHRMIATAKEPCGELSAVATKQSMPTAMNPAAMTVVAMLAQRAYDATREMAVTATRRKEATVSIVELACAFQAGSKRGFSCEDTH